MSLKKLFIPIIFLSLIFLSACQKEEPIDAEEAATLFINRLVYEKESEAFEKNFKDSQDLKDVMDENAENFQQNLLAGLITADETISTETANQLSESLLTQVQEKTSYAAEVKTQDESSAKITYHVTGLNYPQIIQNTDVDLLTAAQGDNTILDDQARLMATIIESLQKNIDAATTIETPQNISITLEKSGTQWSVTQDQSEAVANLYLAFISGAKTQDELSEQLTAVAEKVNADLEAQLQEGN